MRKKLSIQLSVTVFVIMMSFILTAAVNALGGGWGIERGRANEGDVARLVVDQVALMRAGKRIDEAIARPLAAERKKQLLGTSDGRAANAAELTDGVFKWWQKEVMAPAQAIAGNPAASCAEAKIAVQSLLIMMGQRQLFGLETEFQELFDSSRTKLAARCREEALDECIATGRFDQIVQTELALGRDAAIMPLGGGVDANAWVDAAFKQCAIYELHFVSTAKFNGKPKIDTVLDGTITLKFEAEGGILNALLGGKKLGDLLKGETKGGVNPFLVSLDCDWPPDYVTCGPGATPTNPFKVIVQAMEMQHSEFYVDPNGISKQRTVGENNLSLEFYAGGMMTKAVIKFRDRGNNLPPELTIPIEAGSTAFAVAHKKDRVGNAMIYKFERNKRGAYPVIFDFIYADQDIEGRVSASDSTEFKLIHKPEPEPILRVPEPTKKPLKPRARIGG